jgi:hypothetical protein
MDMNSRKKWRQSLKGWYHNMKIYTKTVCEWLDDGSLRLVADECTSFDYEGPVARCDAGSLADSLTTAGTALESGASTAIAGAIGGAVLGAATGGNVLKDAAIGGLGGEVAGVVGNEITGSDSSTPASSIVGADAGGTATTQADLDSLDLGTGPATPGAPTSVLNATGVANDTNPMNVVGFSAQPTTTAGADVLDNTTAGGGATPPSTSLFDANGNYVGTGDGSTVAPATTTPPATDSSSGFEGLIGNAMKLAATPEGIEGIGSAVGGIGKGVLGYETAQSQEAANIALEKQKAADALNNQIELAQWQRQFAQSGMDTNPLPFAPNTGATLTTSSGTPIYGASGGLTGGLINTAMKTGSPI